MCRSDKTQKAAFKARAAYMKNNMKVIKEMGKDKDRAKVFEEYYNEAAAELAVQYTAKTAQEAANFALLLFGEKLIGGKKWEPWDMKPMDAPPDTMHHGVPESRLESLQRELMEALQAYAEVKAAYTSASTDGNKNMMISRLKSVLKLEKKLFGLIYQGTQENEERELLSEFYLDLQSM